jgi:hypothetical protein
VSFSFPGARMVDYHGVVTREFPLWKVTLTGGDLPESGHRMTSMSYARLVDDIDDWVEWHEVGEHGGWIDPERYEAEEAGDDGGGGGEGFSIGLDCRWPDAVKDAERRYWAARKAMQEARAEMTEPIVTIAHELQAEDMDVARIVHMPVRKVSRIILRHNREMLERARSEQCEADS